MLQVDHVDRRNRARAPRAARPSASLRLRWGLVAADAVAIAVAAVAAGAVAERRGWQGGLDLSPFVVIAAVVATVLLFLARGEAYGAMSQGLTEMRTIVRAMVKAAVVLALVAFFTERPVSSVGMTVFVVAAAVLLIVERGLVRRLLPWPRGPWGLSQRVVVVGDNVEGRAIEAALERDPGIGYEVVGFVRGAARTADTPAETPAALEAVVDELVHRTGASAVIVAATAVDVATSNHLVRELTEKGVQVEVTTTLRDIAPQRLGIRQVGQFPVLRVERVCRTGWRSAAKRSFDVAVSAIALALLAPVLAIVALAVRLDSTGPVLFHQWRVGRDGRQFRIHKFRTMVVDAEQRLEEVLHLNEADGPLFKARRDPRATPVGRFLRATSLDELPQLANVLWGDMSLVGPRPALPGEVQAWSPQLRNRLRVRPGMTGMWQVHGRSDANFGDYERLDLYYVDNWSIAVDLALLLRTVPAVVSRRGAC